LSRSVVWQTLAEHAGEVCAEQDGIPRALSIVGFEAEALLGAAEVRASRLRAQDRTDARRTA